MGGRDIVTESEVRHYYKVFCYYVLTLSHTWKTLAGLCTLFLGHCKSNSCSLQPQDKRPFGTCSYFSVLNSHLVLAIQIDVSLPGSPRQPKASQCYWPLWAAQVEEKEDPSTEPRMKGKPCLSRKWRLALNVYSVEGLGMYVLLKSSQSKCCLATVNN